MNLSRILEVDLTSKEKELSPQSRYAKKPENQRLGCVAIDPGQRLSHCDCGANVDWDGNGARGIFLRALLVTTPQVIAGNC
jgi:hypothetical protein